MRGPEDIGEPVPCAALDRGPIGDGRPREEDVGAARDGAVAGRRTFVGVEGLERARARVDIAGGRAEMAGKGPDISSSGWLCMG